MPDSSTIFSRLHLIRRNAQLTQAAMATRLGLSHRAYKNYESGKRDLPITVAITVCEQFATDLSYLISGKESLGLNECLNVLQDVVEAVLTEAESLDTPLSPAKTANLCALAFKLTMQTETKTTIDIRPILAMLSAP